MPTLADSASGSSLSNGAAKGPTLLVPGALSADGTSQSSGDAADSIGLPLGSVGDFGIWDPTGVDPAISCRMAGAAGAPNSRAYIAATAPVTYTTALGTLWNGAVNAAIRATWTPANPVAITAAQFESANIGNLLSGDASDYRSQLVYQRGSVTVSGTTTWDAVVTRSKDNPLTGLWSGKLVNDGGLTPYSMQPLAPAMVPASPGQIYSGTVSVALPRAGAQWTAGLHFYNSSRNAIGTYSYTSMATHPGGYLYQPSTALATAPSGTAYVAVVPHITPAAIGDGEIAYVACHRLTCTSTSTALTPSTFTPARQQNVTVKANRINQIYNPGFNADTFGWFTTGGTTGTSFTQDSTVGRAVPGAAKFVCTYGLGAGYPQVGTSSVGMALLTPGVTYTLSVYVKLAAPMPPLTILAVIGGGGPDQQYILGNSTATVVPDAEGWYRLSVTTPIPNTASGGTGLLVNMSSTAWVANAASVTFWLDDALCEASPTLNDAFDGAIPSPDYLWEGTPNRSRSHYYRDFRALQYRLSGLVGGAVPLGVPYQLLYAQPGT